MERPRATCEVLGCLLRVHDTQHRQRGDPEYCEICRRARYATAPTDAMLQALNARVVSIEQAKQRTKQTALWTATTHKVKDTLNQSQLEDMDRNGATFINVYARHFRLQTSAAGGKRKRVLSGDSIQGDDDFSDCNEGRARSSGDIHSSERRTLLEHNPFLCRLPCVSHKAHALGA